MLYTGAGLVGPGLVIYQLPSYLAATLGERLEAVAGLVICGLFWWYFLRRLMATPEQPNKPVKGRQAKQQPGRLEPTQPEKASDQQ